ncbi:MAG: hypothetical protein HY924_06080 [Elusimicrobia bacterium]|nr:hypothetical protein [Elusimicrobiota bacterium]
MEAPSSLARGLFGKAVLSVLLVAAASAAEAAPFTLQDEGGFYPAGRPVEFHDRYGWRGYRVRFEFGLDSGGRGLTKDSKLTLQVFMRDGETWEYSCRSKGRDGLTANINEIPGKAVSVVAECRIPEAAFAKAVDLDPLDVGIPNIVFQAVVQDGVVRLGAQRGLYILPTEESATGELGAYASAEHSPSNPSVIFHSN